MDRFAIAYGLLVALSVGCEGASPSIETQPPIEDVRVCVDACESNEDCAIMGSPAACVDGRCREPLIGDSPACVDDDDCLLLLATYFATTCSTRDDCVGPSYSGPCVDGHSSGVALCGLPYFGICETPLAATNHETGGEVSLCGTLVGPTHCIEGSCTRRSRTCATDGACGGYGVCIEGSCRCETGADCQGPAARVGSTLICEGEQESAGEGEGNGEPVDLVAFCEVLIMCVPGGPSVEQCATDFENNLEDIRAAVDQRCDELADALEVFYACVSERTECGPVGPAQLECSAEHDEVEAQMERLGNNCPRPLGT